MKTCLLTWSRRWVETQKAWHQGISLRCMRKQPHHLPPPHPQEHKGEAFLAVNPFGKLPALQDGDLALVSGGRDVQVEGEERVWGQRGGDVAAAGRSSSASSHPSA